MEIIIKELETLCFNALTKTGLSDEHARITVDHYLENELSGKSSHGMVRVIQAVNKLNERGVSNKAPEIILDKGHMLIIEAHRNLGPVLGKLVLDHSITRTKEHGLSFITGRNYTANSGSMAYYLRRLAEQNLIGIMSCNSEAMVCAPAGKEPFVGTNPIGLCVPSTNGNHFIADFATSAIAFGKVLVAKDKNETLPEGCIIDKDGNPSINPKDAYENGAILPLADYRGFALGLFVEMMAVAVGAKALNREHGSDGLFIIAIDPNHLGTKNYTSQVETFLTQIRDSAPAPGHKNVSIPGDRSLKTLNDTLKKGSVSVADVTLSQLKELAA